MDDSNTQSRRSLLKKAGAGAALVWAAPAVLSAGSVAAAASGALCPTAECNKGAICDSFQTCGTNNGGRCSCLRTTDAGNPTFCCDTDNICSNPVCTTCDDCPAGWACIVSCCGPGVCAPPCSNTMTPTSLTADASAGTASL